MKKMEKEMENVFETKVKEKKQKLKDSEHELTQKHKNVSHPRPCRPDKPDNRPIGARIDGEIENSVKSIFEIRIQNFC